MKLRTLPRIAVLALIGMACLSGSQGQIGIRRIPEPPIGTESRGHDRAEAEILSRLQRARDKMRYEEMKRDGAKLVAVTTELKQALDRGDALTDADLAQRLEQIEKLARSVKTKMRGD
jgi:hypothetical protein